MDNNSSGFLLSVMEIGETCRVTPDFNANQCIFYPVKEEEREVLLGAAQTNNGSLTTEASTDAQQTENQTADCNLSEFFLFSVVFLVNLR